MASHNLVVLLTVSMMVAAATALAPSPSPSPSPSHAPAKSPAPAKPPAPAKSQAKSPAPAQSQAKSPALAKLPTQASAPPKAVSTHANHTTPVSSPPSIAASPLSAAEAPGPTKSNTVSNICFPIAGSVAIAIATAATFLV